MEIFHRISFNNLSDPQLLNVLQGLGIKYEIAQGPGRKENFLIIFEIQESDVRWELIKNLDLPSRIYTTFTDDEILSADWSRFIVNYEKGYPEPKNSWGKEKNYEVLCKSCGLVRQNALFRIKAEPKLHGHDFMTTYWINEVFCTNRVIDIFRDHEIQGFEVSDVILHKLGEPSETIKQLTFPSVPKPGLVDREALEPQKCTTCNTYKYRSHRRGYWKYHSSAFDGVTDDFVLSNEWFGSGYFAYKEIFVTRKIANIILEQGWKGVVLQPLKLV